MIPRPSLCLALLFALLLPQLRGTGAADAFPERKTLNVDGYAIAYSAGDEAFAQAFAAHIHEIIAEPSAPATLPPVITSLTPAERNSLLVRICHYLSLPQPTPRMTDTFNKLDRLYTLLDDYTKGAGHSLHHFQIWRGTELKARLEAGQSLPNIKIKSDGKGVDFLLPKASGQAGASDMPDFSNWALPVVITSQDTETGKALINKKVKQAQSIYQNILFPFIQNTSVFISLHEAAEQGLIENYLHGKDRRWFCDGAANYVAFKVYADLHGIEAAKRAYDLPAQLATYADLKGKIDLSAWPAVENQSAAERASRENAANYPFAADVFFRIEAKHGPDFLPRLLAVVGKTPRNQINMRTVYRAFRELYHEDLHAYLPRS